MKMRATGLLVCALMALALSPHAAHAQGGATSSITGVVTDTSGGIIPGADVVAKNNATSFESRAVTSVHGAFTIPALNVGTYTVTVSLTGFKTAVVDNVVVSAGVPAAVKAVLELGGVSETVLVQSRSEVIQTTSATVASTLNVNQITKLPLTSRNALDFVVNPAGRQHAGRRARLHRQRPAAERDQHHARRHEHPGQLPEDDRRLLRARRARGSTRSRKSR